MVMTVEVGEEEEDWFVGYDFGGDGLLVDDCCSGDGNGGSLMEVNEEKKTI